MKILRRSVMSLLLAFATAGVANATDYGLPSGIQQGNILHCFNWSIAQVKEALPSIAEAGFGSVQLSPMQRADTRATEAWHTTYRPYDLSFKASPFMGNENDLKALCQEADKYGIKVIVDVVANHVDKTSGYHDTWWDSNGRLRWNGNINYGDRFSITHGQLGDYADINSESAEVIARAKAYVEKLKSLGVKGIRWDAAKHIGLPSEGCNFWKEVTSVAGMYHYGEILDTPGPNAGIINEYAQYMSVTDNKYSNGAAKDNGGIPFGYGGEWVVNQGLSDTKLVYWGECHDTYANDEWSQNVDQSVIDRAYAAVACRKGATALYLARPNTKGFNNIKMGKGSTAYTSKSIAAVNAFRNKAGSQADWCENGGNTFTVTRKDFGAVIVMKGSGQVTVKNGGGFCPAGTYKDQVTGNTFTVTSTTITGNVGQSGIAVIYKGSFTSGDDDNNNGDDNGTGDLTLTTVKIPGDYNLAYEGDKNNVYFWGSTNATWPGFKMDTAKGSDGKTYKVYKLPAGTTGLIFNSNGDSDKTGDLTYKIGYIHNDNGGTDKRVAFNDNGGNSGNDNDGNGVYVYVDGWDNVHAYVYNDGGGEVAAWPGIAMTKDSATGYWKYEVPAAFHNGLVIINTGNNGSNRYPADMQPGMALGGKTKIFRAGTTKWEDFSAISETIVIPIEEDTDMMYFNLQGVRIERPAHGMYIVVRNGKTSKVIVK